MVIRRMLTGDPRDLTQLAEAAGPGLSLARVALLVRCGRQKCADRKELAAPAAGVRQVSCLGSRGQWAALEDFARVPCDVAGRWSDGAGPRGQQPSMQFVHCPAC